MVGVKKKGKGRSKPVFRLRFGRFLFDLVICFLALTLVPVLVYRVLPPPTTPLMWLRWMEKGRPDEFPLMIKDWKRLDDISPSLLRAVIAAEDQKFFIHDGFDWDAVESAVKTNLTTNRTVGASTITMQTARNVFLWQDRSWLRKSLEAYFTFLIETFWRKDRILETYLNIIEWGDGIFGCEAAARTYFNHSSNCLTPVESAWMATILPNPRIWSVRKPDNLEDRQARILQAMPRVRLLAAQKS